MAAIAEPLSDDAALQHQAKNVVLPPAASRRMADAIRFLAIDATEQAQFGSPGVAMGMADVVAALWTRFHKFDAADPHWFDRDRFVVSARDGSMLVYALIHLTGYAGMAIEDIRNFGQLNSTAAGQACYGAHPAIEATTGLDGQGFATAVGMAIAERNMAARFGKSLVDHRTWVVVSEGDLMQGISHECSSLAGHLALSKLTVLYDENRVTADGDISLCCSEDALKRFAAYGWATKRVDGHDAAQIHAALSFAVRSKKPTLVACRTVIAFGAPTKAGSATACGTPLGATEASGTRSVLGWRAAPFVIPDDLAERWRAVGSRGASARRSWLKRLARHNQRPEFERVIAGRLPDAWHEAVAALKLEISETRPAVAARISSQKCLEALVPATPELLGGSADLTASNLTQIKGMAAISAGNFGGRYIHYGSREHAMAAAANGMAMHGGIVPYVGTFLAFSDFLRPAIRMSAIMRQRVVYIFTHDSVGQGGDGPSQQPVEQLSSLRATPNLHVFRPADAMEIAECWELAVRRIEGPSVLVLSRQALPALRTDFGENCCARGGYVLAEAEGTRRATVIATGSEVAIAMAARDKLVSDGIAVAVVSLPCWELFERQDPAYREQVLGGAIRVGIEAAGHFGWDHWLGPDGIFIGMSGFGASGRQQDLLPDFGVTADAVVAAVARGLA